MTAERSTRRKSVRHDLVAMTLAAAASAISLNANAAFDAFAKIGDIKGESADDKHKGESDVLSWSWGALGAAKKAGCGLELTFTKFVDSATPKLIESVAQGKQHPTARLSVRKAGSTPDDFLLITMSNVSVVNVQPGGSSGSDSLLEHVSLTYASATLTYKPQKPDGTFDADIVGAVPTSCPVP
jgi:type VI secretion system secreted protein Hcp